MEEAKRYERVILQREGDPCSVKTDGRIVPCQELYDAHKRLLVVTVVANGKLGPGINVPGDSIAFKFCPFCGTNFNLPQDST